MTGARGLKIANIDKLYIFDMQLFMFLYRGIFFDAALLGRVFKIRLKSDAFFP